jgi:carboxyl-terminal processing protease
MQSKTLRYSLLVVTALVLLCGAFSGGVLVGWTMPNRPVLSGLPFFSSSHPMPTSEATPDANGQVTDLNTLFKAFWETWDMVHQEYVDQPVDDTELMRGAIRGMLDSLGDPHTSYMDPEEFRQTNMPLQGEYEGIGAWVDSTKAFLTIISPMPDSPAAKAGLKAGDQIVAVDGKDMTGVDGSLVLKQVLGPAGTKVRLTIRRTDTEDFDVEIVRAKISLPSAEGKMLDNNIAYVQINTFGENTIDELRSTLKDLMAQKPSGMILDLRNNGGGYLDTAIDVVSEFIPGGKVAMYEEFGDKTRHTFSTKNGGLATDIPLVVLVNEGSASASEITAGAIQDYGRGKLVGVTTYGKGSVQNWQTLVDDQGAVRITIARWLTPKERQINKVGLGPDVEVKITEDDVKANRDTQLEKAIELLLEK